MSETHDHPSRRIRRIVIAGGGTAGWMAATMLAHRLQRQSVEITVIESSAIGTVGVGEATVPAIRDFFRSIDLDEMDVLAETGGTIKLGIAFRDWKRAGHEYFHPFGLYGLPSRGVAFHHYWLKMRGEAGPLDEYSLCTQMAKRGLFMQPAERPTNDLGIFNWAVHFDASRFAGMLRRLAEKNGVARIDDRIVRVVRDGESGHVTALETQGHGAVEGDLFVDCTGFRSLLLGQAMEVPYIDWTQYLPCDRAIAVPCAAADPAGDVAYTTATARPAGWQWRIPLQHRVGNGYVYSSKHISDDAALADLLGRIEGEPLAEPNRVAFTAGHRVRFWERNVVGVGLAAGFLEPLESTSITLIQTAVEKLIDLFPTRDFDPALAAEYNRTTTLEFERVRDFLILHYRGNGRVGEAMWDSVRRAQIPEKLDHKMRLFAAQAKLVRYEWETFLDPSWLSIYAGLEMLPAAHDPMADFFTKDELRSAMARMREAIEAALTHAVPHRDFIARHAPAQGIAA